MYAIVGANGFLGSYIIKAVRELTKEAILATARDLNRVKLWEGVEWTACDVRSEASVSALLDRLSAERSMSWSRGYILLRERPLISILLSSWPRYYLIRWVSRAERKQRQAIQPRLMYWKNWQRMYLL